MPIPPLPDETDNISFLNVSYGIRLSDDLLPNTVTSVLDIQPTFSFSRGDKYLSKTRDPETKVITDVWLERPLSIWRIDTKNMDLPRTVEDHILYLLSILEPKKDNLVSYLEKCSGSFYVEQRTIYPDAIEVSSEILGRMSKLCHFVQFFSNVMGSQEEKSSLQQKDEPN